MAWYDTLINGANTVGNVVNSVRSNPLVQLGTSLYNRNQTNNATQDAFSSYQGFANNSLDALGQVYSEGRDATAPYRATGENALAGYQNLMDNPGNVVNEPGYQWRFDQGAEALSRNAAATGYRGSGNEMMALVDYGQNQATTELDKILQRYVPQMNAGAVGVNGLMDAGRNYSYGVAGINEGLGNESIDSIIGQAGNTTGFLNDFLGMGLDAAGSASSIASGVGNVASGVGSLTNAGAGNPLAAIGQIGKETATGSGGWGDLTSGPRTAARMPTTGGVNLLNAAPTLAAGLGGAGLAGFGTTAGTAGALGTGGFAAGLGSSVGAGGAAAGSGIGAMGGSASAFNSMSAGIGSGVGAGGAGTGLFSTFAGAAGAGLAMIAGLKMLSNIKGGASESAKLPKMNAEIRKQIRKDPSGASAQAFIDKIITNKQWPNESNGDELGTLIQSGMIGLGQTPSFHSAASRYDVWNNDLLGTYTGRGVSGNVYSDAGLTARIAQQLGPYAIAQSYGLSPDQQKQYADLTQKMKSFDERVQRGGDEGQIMYKYEDRRGEDAVGYAKTLDDVPANGRVGIERPNRDGEFLNIPVSQIPGYAAAKASLDSIKARMTPQAKKKYATNLYSSLRNGGYTGDLSKLEAYLRG